MTSAFDDALKGFSENARCADAIASKDANPGLSRAVLALAYAVRAFAVATREGLGDAEVALTKHAEAHEVLARMAPFQADSVERIAAALDAWPKGGAR